MTELFPLEEFRILGAIGKGEFGKVHRAVWIPPVTPIDPAAPRPHFDVALKHVEVAQQGGGKLQAEQDGVHYQRQAWERYPDMVPRVFLDGLAANGDYYIAMEFVRGEALLDVLRRKHLATPEAVRLATIVAGFLQRLHEFQPPILHSDLKPEHVLVLDDGTVRIIDFGIARRPEAGAATRNAFLSVMYAAPERVEDEARNVHPSDDLWALGIILFEMLAGAHPREQYRPRIEDAIRRDDLGTVATLLRERPALLPEGTSPQLDAIVRKMLAPQPGHRYASAAQVLRDLDAYTQGRETVAWQQLVAAGRATRVVTRTAAPGAPTMAVPPPPNAARTVSGPSDVARTSSGPRGEPGGSEDPPLRGVSRGEADKARPTVISPRPRFRALISRRSAGVFLRAAAALLVAFVLMAQVAAWTRVERYRRGVRSLETDDLASIEPTLSRLRRNAPFGFIVPMRLNRPLASRMLELAEPTIADFRNDMPAARFVQWKTASRALAIGLELEPGDQRLRSRARYVEGQLARIDAQGKSADAARVALAHAVNAFREAAQIDDRWPDPYIGLASVHAYGLHDADAVVQDVNAAVTRGFASGKRERAEVADAFAYRADQTRARAAHADGEDRRQLLESAIADYQQCIANYDGVSGFYDSDQNLDRCRSRQEVLTRELELMSPPPLPPPSPTTAGV
ncbi:MAG TPA: serine/threonine-protein kinase [Vicinamibacterales bacterium]|nr:serine/threonine-protein kinase [Vicinamibacterales bacterium]